MKPLLLSLFAGLAAVLVGIPAPARGDVCQTGYCPPAVQVLTPAVVPLYGTGYSGGANLETNQLLVELLAEIKGLRSEVQALRVPANAEGLRAAPDALAVMKANCASCHSGPTPKADFLLFTEKGDPVRLSRFDREAVTKRVKAGTMPPKDKMQLTSAEKTAVEAALKDTPPKK